MSKINSFLPALGKFISVWKVWLIVGVLVVLGGVAFMNGGNGPVETVAVEQGDLVRTVKISGKVVPREKVDLGFEVAGTISSVGKPVGSRVSRGEVLVRLSSGAISADIQKAEAELASATAELQKLEGTAVYENTITNAKRSLVQAMRDAYTTASDAIQNKTDQVFIDPRTSSPIIAGNFVGYSELRDRVNSGRVNMGYVLEEWAELVQGISGSTYTESQLELSKKYLSDVTLFISDLSTAVNMFEVTNYMTQANIDAYKADMLSARQSLNQASQDFIDAEKALAQTLSEVPVQLARVEAARANVANLRYQLSKSTITSPISGIVSRQDAKLGQAVSAGVSLVSVISPDYIIETYVPEVSLAGIRIGNSAVVTMDAYGAGEIFQAEVKHIDPAETLRDGVSTYKTELSFNTPDERIRSGLTANVEIEVMRKPGASLIPERAVLREGEQTFVQIWNEKEAVSLIEVTVGEKDSYGNIEVLSGLSGNELLVLNPER